MTTTRYRFSLFLAVMAALLFPACGGGGGGGGDPDPEPPTNLVYDDMSPTYRTDGPILPNTPSTGGGAPTAYSILPALPAGLSFNTATGVISGNPTVKTAPAPHTVTASNPDGSTQAVVNVEVKWIHHKSIDPQTPVTDADIRHLLERSHFGFHQASYDAINLSGLASYLSNALDAINENGTLALEVEADAYVEDPTEPGLSELAHWWEHCIQRTGNPLQESLALHWHDHFACSSDVLGETSAYWFFDHLDLLRHNAAGNLRDFVIALSRDWTMLEYLDGRDSKKNAPNENYGREYMELYLFGVNNGYDQADIEAAAALFSGYRRYFDGTQHFIDWTPTEHNQDEQTFLGVVFPPSVNPPADIYDQIVDVSLAHKPVGETIGYASRWVVRSLLRRYCYENPDPILIDQLATLLESGNWELKPLFMALFQSEAFFSAQSKVGFVKTPTEHMVGFIRTTGLPIPVENADTPFGGFRFGLDTALAVMGNRPSQPPVVAGWPEGESWLSAQGLIDRANVLDFIIVMREFQADEGADPADLLPPGVPTAQQVVESIALRMQVELTPAEVQTLVDYLNTSSPGNSDVVPAIPPDILSEPFDPTNPDHIDERVRGLLYILGQHPSYLLR